MEIVVNGVKTQVVSIETNSDDILEIKTNVPIRLIEGEGLYIKDVDVRYIDYSNVMVDDVTEEGLILYRFEVKNNILV